MSRNTRPSTVCSPPAPAAEPSARRRLRNWARWGYVAKGLIYLTIGQLTFEAAWGFRRMPADSRGALKFLHREPHGPWLLCAIALALFLFAAWRLVDALTIERQTTRLLRWGRFGHRLLSAGIHGGLAWTALRLFFGWGSGLSSERASQRAAAIALRLPWGRTLTGGAALLVAGMAVYQFGRAFRGSVWKDLRCGPERRLHHRALAALGRIGEFSRGVLFAWISAFLWQAARLARPDRVHSYVGAFRAIGDRPYGVLFLSATASGLMAFGLYLILSARLQRL